MALIIKNSSANARDIGDVGSIPGDSATGLSNIKKSTRSMQQDIEMTTVENSV